MSSVLTFLHSFKDITFILGEFIGVLGVGIGLGVFTTIKRKNISLRWNSKKELKKQQSHSAIHETITELRVLVRSSRVVVFQYHNGGKFADGSSIQRFSITHESCSSGSPSMMIESQDSLLTRYMELVGLLEKQPNKIIRVSSLPECALRLSFDINNVVYFSVSPLKCRNMITPMGFVCCHWCNLVDLDDLLKEDISEDGISEVIEGNAKIINNHLNHNAN